MRTKKGIACALFVFCVFAAIPGRAAAQEFPPTHPLSIYREAVAARADGDYFRAIELLRDAITRNPAYFDAVFALAEIYFFLEEYDQALDICRRALTLAPASIPAQVLNGRILVATGDLSASRRIFEAILREEPNNIEARLAIAELDVASGRNRNAINEYRETLRIAPQSRKALLSLALIYQAAGNSGLAGEYFNLAVRHHGDSDLVQLFAGEFFLAEGNLPAARRHAGLALTLRPQYEEAYMLLGQIELREGNYGALHSAMDTVLHINRNNTAAWYLKAIAALHMGNSREAITLLRTLLSMNPENEIARLTLENTLREFFPVEDPLRREFANYHFLRGNRFMERHLFSRAYEGFRRGLQIYPYSVEGRVAFADVVEKLGFYARSYAALQFLQDQDMADADVLESLEMGASFLEDRVSRTWNIDQLLVPRRKFNVSLFFDSSSSSLIHRSSGIYITRYFSDLLVGSALLSPPEITMEVNSYGEAFHEARQRGSDYFLMINYAETPREFMVRADLYLSRTGGQIDSFQVYRTGNDRVQNSLTHLLTELSAKFPLRGDLLQRDFDRGLINLGQIDGIRPGDSLFIIERGALDLRHDRLEFNWNPEAVLGTLTITRVDDMVAEGTVQRQGFFDRINPGDTVFREATAEERRALPPPPIPDRPLYRRIQGIR